MEQRLSELGRNSGIDFRQAMGIPSSHLSRMRMVPLLLGHHAGNLVLEESTSDCAIDDFGH